MEGPLQNKLTEVRAKADEARAAKLRANAALYEGLSAAYDFALDAEEHAEEYLKLVEAQGLKIQLRSPMKPVVKLAFEECATRRRSHSLRRFSPGRSRTICPAVRSPSASSPRAASGRSFMDRPRPPKPPQSFEE